MTGCAVRRKLKKPAEAATVDATSTQRRLPVNEKRKTSEQHLPPPYGRRFIIMRTRPNAAVGRASYTCVKRFKIEPAHGSSVTYRIGQRFRETRAHGRQTGPGVLDSVGEPDEVVHAQQGAVLSQRPARRGVPFVRGHGIQARSPLGGPDLQLQQNQCQIYLARSYKPSVTGNHNNQTQIMVCVHKGDACFLGPSWGLVTTVHIPPPPDRNRGSAQLPYGLVYHDVCVGHVRSLCLEYTPAYTISHG